MNHRQIISQAALIIGVVLFSAGLQTFAVFTPPTAPPPQADAYAPLNTGPDAQAKIGGLLLNLGGAPNGLIVQSGNVGIGVANPTKKLEVAGEIVSSGNITSSGDICMTGNGGVCLTRLAQTLAPPVGNTVFLQSPGCPNAGYVVADQTCTTISAGYSETYDAYGNYSFNEGYRYNCSGGYEGTGWSGYAPYTCLNRSIGNLISNGAVDNTVTIRHPSRTESISCGMNVAGMPITITAAYDLGTNRYTVSGPWINTTLSMGGSAQGCYSGGCGDAQTNINIENNRTTSYTRNASGGITTTIVDNAGVHGSFWLSNGRGSSECRQGFSS